MNRLHARYPFLQASREAVGGADVTLRSLVEAGDPAVERARERVRRALIEGTVASETPRQWDAREELLSYPVARVVVSLLDVPAAVEKYAVAEAATARERFEADLEADGQRNLRSLDRPTLTRDRLLREFDVADDVRAASRTNGARTGAGAGTGSGATAASASSPDEDGFRVAVTAYLRLSDSEWGDEWRLAVRELAAGEVWVTRTELYRMLQEAVRRRVVEGLPFDVRSSESGEAIATALEEPVEELRALLSDHDPVSAPDVVIPDLFPPCIEGLLARARDGESLDPHSAFTLQAFCADVGMDAAAIADLQGTDERAPVEYRLEFLDDDGRSQYPPPSCATVQSYGDCPGPDERCERIHSPLAYYADAVAATASDDDGDDGGDGDDEGDEGGPARPGPASDDPGGRSEADPGPDPTPGEGAGDAGGADSASD
jgi:DNA primase large subunit